MGHGPRVMGQGSGRRLVSNFGSSLNLLLSLERGQTAPSSRAGGKVRARQSFRTRARSLPSLRGQRSHGPLPECTTALFTLPRRANIASASKTHARYTVCPPPARKHRWNNNVTVRPSNSRTGPLAAASNNDDPKFPIVGRSVWCIGEMGNADHDTCRVRSGATSDRDER